MMSRILEKKDPPHPDLAQPECTKRPSMDGVRPACQQGQCLLGSSLRSLAGIKGEGRGTKMELLYGRAARPGSAGAGARGGGARQREGRPGTVLGTPDLLVAI
jgi:hypothetical protein